ncbi:chemotaxis protein CheA [Halobellus salinisoli]|uniref:chemotaxis protein CheA n=1 Tax=Halobellus salinisoli TaxID=3108500 RepID=UPI00300B368A
MDDELYQEFITESEESITQLNNSLLDLEANPEDAEAIDDIFRQAHTLKGNFGAMGFDNAATVAHAVEDLLDAVRNDEIEVTTERMDLVFDGMDEILDILREIESHGESRRDPSDLVESLRAAAEPETATGSVEAERGGSAESAETDASASDDSTSTSTGSASTSAEPSNHEALDRATDVLDADDPALANASHLYHARIELDAGDMKGVDGGLFVSGLPDDLAVVGAEPNLNCIAEGDFEGDFVIFVADASRAELESTLEDIWKVNSVALTDVGAFLDEANDVTGAAGTGAIESHGDGGGVEGHGDAVDDGGDEGHGDAAAGEEVDEVSAAAAVDAVVEAYTSTGDADDGAAAGSGVDDAEGEAVADVRTDESAVGANESDEAVAGEHGNGADDTEGTAESDPEDVRESNSVDTAEGETEGSDAEAGGRDEGDEGTPSISEVKSVRVDVDQLDELHSLVEQLVTSRIKLRQAMDTDETAGKDTIDELDKISSNLQDTVMDMRLIPLKKVFDKFPRLVRDLAREEDKKVRFSVEGQDIELDRTILDEISDPLMHVLRNAVDHGIESPDERVAAGKSRTGSIELRAEREHDTVVITVEDDGGGIDADAIREKAAENGIRSREELAELPDEEVYDFVFHPGFSTNDEITDVSGRGVGMDVVKTTVESLDGSVNVDSTLGEGTSISIRLPVTVAIIKVLFVRIDDREFGVPIKYIDEISRQQRIQRVDGAEVVVHEDHIFPLIRLREALSLESESKDGGMIVRVRPADRQVALRCDGVARQEEVVVTPLQGPLKGTEGLSGTAVVGDGNVVPILDINSLSIPERGKQARRQWIPPEDENVEAEGAAD